MIYINVYAISDLQVVYRLFNQILIINLYLIGIMIVLLPECAEDEKLKSVSEKPLVEREELM
jgi:hypothetical protein